MVIICGIFFFSGCRDRFSGEAGGETAEVFELKVVRRFSAQSELTLPVESGDLLIFADMNGSVSALGADWKPRWNIKIADGKRRFTAGGALAGDMVCLASLEGTVYAFDTLYGSVIWRSDRDAVFEHRPLYGSVGDRAMLWLLSASDGVIHAFDATDGELLFESEPTNRSDGGAVVWKNVIAYGNCDGAAHFFNAADGSRLASVAVGDTDQMAGTPLVGEEGMLFIGTRSGKLAVIDLQRMKLITTLEISQAEAFVEPVKAFDGCVAMGTDEGDLLLCSLVGSTLEILRRVNTEAPVERLAFHDDILYVLSGGDLVAYNRDLEKLALLNVADRTGGVMVTSQGLIVIRASNTLIGIEGGWR